MDILATYTILTSILVSPLPTHSPLAITHLRSLRISLPRWWVPMGRPQITWWASVFHVDKNSCLEEISIQLLPREYDPRDSAYKHALSFTALDAALASNANLPSLRVVTVELLHHKGSLVDWDIDSVFAYLPRLHERGILRVEYDWPLR